MGYPGFGQPAIRQLVHGCSISCDPSGCAGARRAARVRRHGGGMPTGHDNWSARRGRRRTLAPRCPTIVPVQPRPGAGAAGGPRRFPAASPVSGHAACGGTAESHPARSGQTAQPLSDVVAAEDVALLQALNRSLEGATARRRNPHAPTRWPMPPGFAGGWVVGPDTMASQVRSCCCVAGRNSRPHRRHWICSGIKMCESGSLAGGSRGSVNCITLGSIQSAL